jgi:hypothetical protein
VQQGVLLPLLQLSGDLFTANTGCAMTLYVLVSSRAFVPFPSAPIGPQFGLKRGGEGEGG